MPHMRNSRNSVCEGAAKLFDHRVGQHFAGNTLHFGLRFVAAESAIERQFEVLALANFFQTLVAHLLKRTVNGLALGIENAFLERNVNVGFHRGFNYTSAGLAVLRSGPERRDKPRGEAAESRSAFKRGEFASGGL